MFLHVLPNIAEPIILNTALAVGYALLAMSGQSFIGLGVLPPDCDWGLLLDETLERIFVTTEAALGPGRRHRDHGAGFQRAERGTGCCGRRARAGTLPPVCNLSLRHQMVPVAARCTEAVASECIRDR